MPTWGRGGAGNIVTEEQIKEQNRRAAEDIEANQTLTKSAAPPAHSEEPQNAQQQQSPADYAHMGRGGAGNWYQPTSLRTNGTFSTTPDSTAAPAPTSKPNVSTPWHPDTQELPVARAGRGGAGNFVWKGDDVEAERKRLEEEEKKGDAVKEGVERDVEIGLQKPGAVVFGGEKRGRGW
ncbi:hypothetical protein BU24DRAFT_416255 [Aaosphaeria arxii CBS 175.79]|uniref:Uncharacterized protein n=1 Tax=Aaosphaeria arxii CBS 175.79 TaxID=1450172 RepID=A0A6A5Y6E2_9PLEO|nr:uncharacterized protein BU24DRAFT_416255 [Aaosphaeria arxii CBS 175.79]KAF2020587.1 hypothetical protein BU24DRAFT_416255 [Aaosphaeria arxii CBS 175.79]